MPTLDDLYELSTELGRGATGTVWEARDRASSKVFAVKVLEPRLIASRRARRRFRREVETASKLRHPHVVEVYAHGQTREGGAYLVMERLVGKTLSACVRESGPLPQPRAIRIIAQVLDAVLAAHRLGVVHRDLKPSNVMLVERDGDPDFVKVCDFGLAKDIERDSFDPVVDGALAIDLGSVTTEHGHICGTPEYMAPEQARGENVDERADLYAISGMLFHVLLGRPPFSARSPLAVVSLHLTAPPPRPRELRPDLDIFPPLENLILRGLAKDRTERPSSAEVFRKDLLRIARDYAAWKERRVLRSGTSAPPESETVTLAPEERVSRLRAPTRWLSATSFVALAAFATFAATSGRMKGQPSPVRLAPSSSLTARTLTATVASVATAPRAASPVVSAQVAVPALASSSLVPALKTKIPSGQRGSPLARASQALAAGRVEEGCAIAENASHSGSASSATFKFLGQCFMRLGNVEKAKAYYRRYLELSPSSSDAVFVREMVK